MDGAAVDRFASRGSATRRVLELFGKRKASERSE
jgi:hypothetical protein